MASSARKRKAPPRSETQADAPAPISPELKNAVLEFEAFLKIELGRSANTVASYVSDVSQFARFLRSRAIASFADVDADALVEWTSQVSRGAKASTQSRKLSALKALALFLVDEKIWEKNFCDYVARPKFRRNAPEVLSVEEVAALLESPPKDTPEGARDRAMLELMYGSGLRVSELCSIKGSDIDVAERVMRVRGKGSKTRLVPVGDYALEAIGAYMPFRAELLGGRMADELFVTRRGAKMSRKTFWYNIKKYARAVGIEKNVKPHILRHSFATHLLRNGANLMSIREMLGHSDLATTQIYTTLMDGEIRRQHAQKHPRSSMDV
ncbi:MAG: tyrosine recombinase XerD [Opitutales bacterium]|nr:tyrosine recombinase XerD [Opitutales bacterium]